MSGEKKGERKILDFMEKQHSILDRVVESLDNIDRRVKKLEEKIP